MTFEPANLPTYSPRQAINAIRARIQGVFDDPDLMKLGALHVDADDDVLRIVDRVRAADDLEAMPCMDGLTVSRVASLTHGSLNIALDVVEALARSRTLEGFDSDDEVDGADAVELLGEIWPAVRAVVPRARRTAVA